MDGPGIAVAEQARHPGSESAPLVAPTRPFGARYSVLLVRCLLLLGGLFLILWAGYQASTNWRNDRANGPSAPIVAGSSFGQTFIARYPNLSGIEVMLGTPDHRTLLGGSLAMHLKSAPGNGPDLATASIPSSVAITDGSWYLFSFPAVTNSQARSYYVEFTSSTPRREDALSVFRWQSDPKLPSDPYQYGTAYLNREPQQADMAFGVHYTPTPIDAWRTLLGAALAGVPVQLQIAFVVFGLLVVLAGLALWLVKRQKIAPERWFIRYSLPIVLVVALVNGLAYALLIPPWQGPDEHGHYTYTALLDRYGLNNSRVQSLDWAHPGPDLNNVLALKQVIVSSMNRNNWTRLHGGDPLPGGSAFSPGPENIFLDLLWETRQPRAYYVLSAFALGAARGTGIPANPYTNPELSLRIMREVSVLLSIGIAALSWLTGKLLTWNKRSWLPLLLPLSVTMLPMNAFICSMASNDVMAEFSATALFACLVALLRRPFGWRAVGVAVLSILAGGLCLLSKSTAAVLVPPLLGLGLMTWLGTLVTHYLGGKLGRQRARVVVPLAMLAALVVGSTVVLMIAFAPDAQASGWQAGAVGQADLAGQPTQRAPRVQSAGALDGSAYIQLPPRDLAYQWIDLPAGHPAMTVTLSAWVRVPKLAPAPPRIGLLLDERGRLPRLGTETLKSVEAWSTITPTVAGTWLTATLSARAIVADRKVMVRLDSRGGTAQFDGLSLAGTPLVPVPGQDSLISLPIFNPSFEAESIGMRPGVARFVPNDEVQIIDGLVNQQSYDKLAAWQRFAYRQFRSFWGDFGWLSIPLPENVYSMLNVVVLGALAGLVWSGLRRAGRWSGLDWLAPVSLVALASIILVGFARQLAPAPTSGVFTDPQGRYLFVMMVPVVWLLISGLGTLWSLLAGFARRIVGRRTAVGQIVPWSAWLWTYMLLLFAGYSLLALVLPYYYG